MQAATATAERSRAGRRSAPIRSPARSSGSSAHAIAEGRPCRPRQGQARSASESRQLSGRTENSVSAIIFRPPGSCAKHLRIRACEVRREARQRARSSICSTTRWSDTASGWSSGWTPSSGRTGSSANWLIDAQYTSLATASGPGARLAARATARRSWQSCSPLLAWGVDHCGQHGVARQRGPPRAR